VLDNSLNLAWTAEPDLHSASVASTGDTDHPDSTYRPVTAPLTRACPTGRVELSITGYGESTVADVSGQIAAQIDGAVVASCIRDHVRAGGPGAQTYECSLFVDVSVGDHAFRLVARKRAGGGLLTVDTGAGLYIKDVRK